jgi:serine/threonine-protein kinase
MAVVYCGTDTVLRRRVAIKVLREQYATDAEFVRRFYQEAESAAKLSHPNIVNTYDVGREGDTYYIVMEYVDGCSLADIIADGPLPEPVALDYAAQICTGLAYAHRAGLLHRDIKPANILVTTDDVVKLSDFGIARAVSQQTMTLTRPGLVMGSVYYISPEQAQGHELHETSDLYSVGVVIYQMLTGELPYGGESPVTVALKHIGDPVPTLDTSELGVSPALASIVNKLLQKRPENRFRSASDVATALREARERPAVAAFGISDDAPAQSYRSVAPPPRRSPLPDRRYAREDDADERPRAGFGTIVIFAILALVATAAGYALFTHPLQMPNLSGSVSVGDYTTMTDTQAQAAVVNDGLVARFIKSPSDTVPANHVIRQNPTPGTLVERNSTIELVISNGLPLVGLPDVRGYSFKDAQRTLQDDGFTVKQKLVFASDPKDSVIDQLPKPRSEAPKGASVTLTVSQGPAPIAVPNFVNMTLDDAAALAKNRGISLDASQRVASAEYPANTIASQDVPAGQKIDSTTIVHVAVSSGVPAGAPGVTIPSVVGTAYAAAVTAIQGAGFTAGVRFSVQSDKNGTVIAQDPAAGGEAAKGAIVTITLSVSGEVPDTEGEALDAARITLEQDGYTVGSIRYTSSEGADGKVVGTDPQVGTALQPGSPVTLIVNGTPH